MSLEFYFGDRQIDEFDLNLHGDKARLNCTVIERWDELFSRVLKCGTQHTEVVTRRFGISTEERQNLEATVKGSLGLSGIAELKSQLTGKTEKRIEFNESQDVKREFKFESPRCGRLDLVFYQLKRIYRFRYEDRRFWHTGGWTRNFSEWVDRIYDDSRKYSYDPDCDCQPKSEPKFDGTVTLVLNEKIGMSTGFLRTNDGVSIPELNISVSDMNVHQSLVGTFRVRRNLIPSHLLFLAGETGETLVGRLSRLTANNVIQQLRLHTLDEDKVERKTLIPSVGLGYLVTGACIGAALGFLFAPKAWDQRTTLLASKADEGREYAQRKARELQERADDLIERSKEIMRRQQDSFPAAVEAGEDAYLERKEDAKTETS